MTMSFFNTKSWILYIESLCLTKLEMYNRKFYCEILPNLNTTSGTPTGGNVLSFQQICSSTDTHIFHITQFSSTCFLLLCLLIFSGANTSCLEAQSMSGMFDMTVVKLDLSLSLSLALPNNTTHTHVKNPGADTQTRDIWSFILPSVMKA